MELLQPLHSVIVIQLYWITIVFIGWMLTTAILNRTSGTFIDNWQALPLAAKLVIATGVSFALFGVFTIIGYSLSLPSWWLGISYLGSLTAACVYAYAYQRHLIFSSLKGLFRNVQAIKLFSPLGLLSALIVVDLGLCLFIGSFMAYDAFIHVSKIRHLIESGFTLTDAYYGTVPETRHAIGVLHTLWAIPSWFGIDPISSWYASLAFFKLVKTAVVFYLAWSMLYWLRKELRIQYAALGAILSLGLFSTYLITYPALFVCVWIILLIIGLLDIAKGRHNVWLLVIASLLIALTHPIASLASAPLLVMVLLAFGIFARKILNKKVIGGMVGSIAILLSTPLFTLTLPNQMTEFAKNYGMSEYRYINIGPLQAFKPNLTQYLSTDVFAMGLTWPIIIVSLAGIIGFFVFIKNRQYRIVIGALVLYVPLIIYNPLVFSVLDKVLPQWAIARFTVVNQLTVVMFLFGLLLIGFGIAWAVRSKSTSPKIPLLIISFATIGVFATMQTFNLMGPRIDGVPSDSAYRQQKASYDALRTIAQVVPDDRNAVILAERYSDGFRIPVVAPLRVVAINEANSTPAADMTRRTACFERLYETLEPEIMKQANVSYVLVNKDDIVFYEKILRHPRLSVVREYENRAVFRFDDSNLEPSNVSFCQFRE